MPTYTALTTLAGRRAADALGRNLEDLVPEPAGVGVFEIEDGAGRWEVGAYFTERPDEIGLALLAAAHGAEGFLVSELPETDWVAKVQRALRPVEAGRFFVYGSHDAARLPAGRTGLLIEASMAFGTGHHGTTLGCLRAIDRLYSEAVAPRNVADIGCGTAVLAMAAAKIWSVPVWASDIDPVAVEVAEANVRANGLADRVTCLEAAGFNHPDLAAACPFELVFGNILKAPLIALAPDMAGALASGGHAILSGILIDQVADVLTVYDAAGFEQIFQEDVGEWSTITLGRTV